jgi:hypothetical protein
LAHQATDFAIRDADSTPPESTTRFARAHYTSGVQNPHSDIMGKDDSEARARIQERPSARAQITLWASTAHRTPATRLAMIRAKFERMVFD